MNPPNPIRRAGLATACRAACRRLLPVLLCSASAPSLYGQEPPASFTRTYTHAAGSLTVSFALQSARGANYEVYVHGAGDTYATYTPGRPARTYLGTVSGYPGAIAVGQRLSDSSVRTSIIFEDGTIWRGTGTSMILPSAANWTPQYPTAVVSAGGAGSHVYGADLGLDLTYTYYNQAGQNLDEVLERAEWAVMESNAIYLRDLAIFHRIGRVVIRTDSSDDRSTSLSELRNEWNNVLPAVLPSASYQLAASVQALGSSGLASVGAIGNNNAYSWNSISGGSSDGNFATVWRHEAGHNWGSGHYAGGTPEGPTIMSGNSLSRFSSGEAASILGYRNSRLDVLENLGSFGLPLPPRANGDRAKVHFTLSPITLDVLANDSDSNGETIEILSFDAVSQRGGTILRSAGSGPGGRDQLVYTPPTTDQLDWFSYRIEDAAGLQAVGWVMIQPATQAPDPDTVADFVSIASGDWSAPATWDGGVAPAAGNHYAVSAGDTVHSTPINAASGSTVTFPGDSLAVEGGATLRLTHNSAGGNNTHTVQLSGLILRDGAAFHSYNTAAGNVTRNLSGPVVVASGTATIRIQSDSSNAYTNALRIQDGIFGEGNLALTGSLQGQSGDRRLLYAALPNVTYAGNWTVTGDGTTNAARRLFLVAEAANALGTGTVTLNQYAQLRNAASGGLDSLLGVTLTSSTSTLQLIQPWNAPVSTLDIQDGTVDLGSGNSVIGRMTIGGQSLPPGTYNAAALAALGYGGAYAGSGTITLVTVSSVASGDWSDASLWENGVAPAGGFNYRVSGGNTINSVSASVGNGGSVTFPGDWIAVSSGGVLRLRHTSAGGNNTHTVDLNQLLLEDGATLQSYNTQAGNVVRNLSSPLLVGNFGSVSLRIHSDSSYGYTNALRLNGGIEGAAQLSLSGSLQGQSGVRRILYVNSSNDAYSGDWLVQGDSIGDSARRLHLVAEASHALGTGSVTLLAYAQLHNAAAGGIDSLRGVTLSAATCTLQLSEAWDNPIAVLVLEDGTLDLGSSNSTIGTMSIGGTDVPTGSYSATSLAALSLGGSFTGSGTLTITGQLSY